uniref:Cas12f1-like TNB domain-containing protein n=1 Tax=Ignisphaera aggregans TaxID=334771 RepID=A0A7C4BCL2_9CREN
MVVNELWSLDGKLSRRKLHEMFYDRLRKLGFRAHHVKQIYTYAQSVVESTRANGGGRPVLRRLTARIDRYDYRLDLEDKILVLKLHSGYEVKLKLIVPGERIEKFKNWSSYELVVKYTGEGFWVSVYFKRVVKPVRAKTVMAIDLNFDNLTLAVFALNGELIKLKRFKTPLRKILTHRIWFERIQKRYSRSWRFIEGVRNAIAKHGERIKNISWDYSHKIGDLVAELALKHHSVIIMEGLDGLRGSAKGDKKFNKKLTLWFYRRIQFSIEYEGRERGLRAAKVSPRGTSSKCPKCGSRLADNGHRTLRCSRCGFVGDRDVVATINLYKRFTLHSKCGEHGVSLNAPEPDEAPSGVRGNKDEAMKIT